MAVSEPTDQQVITKLSNRTVGDTVERFSDIAATKGITIFAVIDQTEAARQSGLELRQTTLILFGNPAAGTPVMVASPMSALDLPLKILVWDDDGQTTVMYLDPAALARRYGLSDDLAAGLAGINALTDALVAP